MSFCKFGREQREGSGVYYMCSQTNGAMELVEYLHYNIPRFQIDGNYELALSADGVSSETLTGTALNVSGQDCTSGDVYAYVKWVPVLEDALS